MKLSISLADADVLLLDDLAAQGGFASRSAVVQYALGRLRAQGLQADYAEAWDEWTAEGDAAPWDATVSDGIAPRNAKP